MQPKYFYIFLLVATGAIDTAAVSAESCVPPAGFVDTPRPEIAASEELVTHIEEVTIERPLAAVLDLNSKTPLRINRSGALPGVTGIHRLNQGPFQAGARRLVCLTDGSTASEEVLVWDRSPDMTRHRYMVWNYTSPAFGPVSYAIGEFVHTAIGETRTRVRWTYSFKLKPGSDASSFREKFMDREWMPYMRTSMAGNKARAEELLPAP
jgi:hypothetical protein